MGQIKLKKKEIAGVLVEIGAIVMYILFFYFMANILMR